MNEELISADDIADFEARYSRTVPQRYVGIPKPVFGYLTLGLGQAQSKLDAERVAAMESVLLTLTTAEAYEIMRGIQLTEERRSAIASECSLPVDSVKDAVGYYWFFYNEGRRKER